MSSQGFSITNVVEKPHWCTLIDPTEGGPLKLCLGLSDCRRCGFAQWLDLMDADPPVRGTANDIPVRLDPASAA